MAVFDHWIWIVVSPIIAYLIGSIPFAYLVTKWHTGKDIRKLGTQNVGGLNAMINMGFNWGFLAGFMDFTKGLICFILALVLPFNDTPFNASVGYWEISQHGLIYILVATAAVLGHCYSIYLKFKGGRGLAVMVGLFCVANPLILLIFTLTLALLSVITKYLRPATFLTLFIVTPIAFFFDFFPPWVVNQNLNSLFVLGLLTVGIVLAILPKYIMPTINMFRGKEYTLGKDGTGLPDKNGKINGIDDT
ncbi:MAG: glycerol-3-phosphate acyltransferase [Candidatus Heimdallarchaeota archaeon]